MNRLREQLPFSEVPIRLLFSRKQRKTIEKLKEDGRMASKSKPDGVDGIDQSIWDEEDLRDHDAP